MNRGCLFVQATDQDGLFCAAEWPADSDAPDSLSEIATVAITQRQAAARALSPQESGPGLRSEIGVPFRAGDRVGVVAVEVIHGEVWDTEPSCKSVIDALIRGAAWLETLVRDNSSSDQSNVAIELIQRVIRSDSPRDAAAVLATELVTRCGCERVSVGWLKGKSATLWALSHSSDFDPESDLGRALSRAMEEAIDQDSVVCLPPSSQRAQVTLEHQALREAHGGLSVCTVPLVAGGAVVGAITAEANPTAVPAWAGGKFALLCRVAEVAGPLLELKRRAADGVPQRIVRSAREIYDNAVHRGGETRKAFAAVGVALTLFFVFAKGEYRVSANATLEGRVQRAVVASFDGYVAEAHARAGDIVTEGKPLARLEDRDLALERRRWAGRHAQLSREHREAFASHDRSQVRILGAQLDQAKARLALAEEQLARSTLLAPFSGVVVRGDLSQNLGSPVERGEVLFEVAPLDGYRIILSVDEREISQIEEGQQGELALSAVPDQNFSLTVERIIPVSVAQDGRNTFRVEASLDRPIDTLRPGMEGVGKISIDRRRYAWIWTHEIVRWFRLTLWSWLP